jgi:hypothetical protein
MTPKKSVRPLPVFIDIEASGLGPDTFPTELGWCQFPNGRTTSLLIQPHASWQHWTWDPAAEALTGISRPMLAAKGRTVEDAAVAINKALAGKSVWSDNPGHDTAWLAALFLASGLRPSFTVGDMNLLLLEIADPDVALGAWHVAQGYMPLRHRAGDDAQHLREVYRIALANGR